jgi:hypothetical protein
MPNYDSNIVEWREPWYPLSDQAARQRLELELKSELAIGHVLFGRSARAIASRQDCDDVLFKVTEPPQLAVVHLSYASRPDHLPWPRTESFESMGDFIERRMNPDHADFTFDI